LTQIVSRLIERYHVTHYGGGKRIAPGTNNYPFRAIIALWDNKGIIAGLYFHVNPNTMPDGDYLPDVGQPMVHYPMEEFPRILDILRSEKPVYYQQSGNNWSGMAGLTTVLEPVGEGELAAGGALALDKHEEGSGPW
jgi:hypothetical protein